MEHGPITTRRRFFESVFWTTASISFRAVRTTSLDLEDWKVLGGSGIGDLGEKLPEEFHVEVDLGVSMGCNLALHVLARLRQP